MNILKQMMLALALMICAAPVPASGAGDVPARSGVEIRQGKESRVAGTDLKLKFLSVVSDSRCPVGVQCVWAGNASVRLRASNSKGRHAEFELNSYVKPLEYDFGGYQIKLAGLTPRPSAKGQSEPRIYTATFTVTKSKP